ncbi:MAG: hypothetical protein ACXVBQ_02655 [Pseudobdellovibrionaceae bacterium]
MSLHWYDIASTIILHVCGAWKLYELSNKWGEKSGKWLVRKTKEWSK